MCGKALRTYNGVDVAPVGRGRDGQRRDDGEQPAQHAGHAVQVVDAARVLCVVCGFIMSERMCICVAVRSGHIHDKQTTTSDCACTHLQVHGLGEEGLQPREARRGDAPGQEADADGDAVCVRVDIWMYA